MFSAVLGEVLLPGTEGDPGLLFGRGHQLRSDLHQRVLQLVELELPHQDAEQHGRHGVGEPLRRPHQLQDAGAGTPGAGTPGAAPT